MLLRHPNLISHPLLITRTRERPTELGLDKPTTGFLDNARELPGPT